MLSKGELIFSGVAQFPAATGSDGARRVIDVPRLGAEDDGIVELSIRNGSATEVLAVNVGHLRNFRPYPKDWDGQWKNAACADTLATLTTTKPHGLKVGDRLAFNTVPVTPAAIPTAAGVIATDVYNTATAHGLAVGDALYSLSTVDCITALTKYYVIATASATEFQVSASRGGATVNVGATTDQNFLRTTGNGGLTMNLYYYVVDPLFLMTDLVFQVSATPGGVVFNIDSDTEVVSFRYLPSPISAIPSAAGVAATDVYNTLTPHGLTVGDAVILDANATVDCVVANTIYYVIATATALQFQISAARGGTTLNVGATNAVALKLAAEFVSLTAFTVPAWAAGTYLVEVAGLASKVVQGFAASEGGGRICISPTDETYVAFAVSVEIRRG